MEKTDPVTEDIKSILAQPLQNNDIVSQFIQTHKDSGNVLEVNEKALLRKIDWALVPLMLSCYTLQFLDKVVLNYARVMGLAVDLKLKGNEFNWLPTAFFIAYMFAEFPQGFLLQKFSPSRVLGLNVIAWGIITACCAAPHNFGGMLAVRILLGISESAISPCLMIITTMWYTKSEASFRCGIWYCGLGLGQIFGGILSYLFQLVTASFEGWRIFFIVLGVINAIVGVLCYIRLPDNPVDCKFLTDDEKYMLLMKLSKNETGVQTKKFVPKQVLELLLDIQAWQLLILTICISFSSNTISTFSSVDIMSFGFTSKEAALLGMPSGIVSIVSTLVSTYFVMKGTQRWLGISILLLPAITGGALMSFLPDNNQGGLLTGIYLINTVVAPLALIYSWVGANFSGHTKKIGANIFIMIGFSLGNIIGPQSYRANDAPHYIPAKISMLATQAAGVFFSVTIALVYYFRNKSRAEFQAAEDDKDEQVDRAWSNLTDFENRHFRYCY